MAIPSGSGTEVLKRASKYNNSDAWYDIITGQANHIYTIISIVAAEQAGNAETLGLRIDVQASGSNQINLARYNSINLPANGVFTWNDKIVLSGTDKLQVYNSAGTVHWYVSYIDQDWS
tara:strand:+ start:93 stop:449 length:357 start_codon:yes stop_codon:yes gene_type:complete